jgi:integrase
MAYKNGLTIYDVTTKFLKQFEKKYMKDNISLATIGSYLRNLRSVINFAMDTEGLIHSSYKYPFGKGGYQIKGYFPSKTALTKNEIDFIVNFENYKNKDQKYALCIWKTLYYLNGSNFVDLLRLKWSDIKGQKIVFVRKKTEFTRTNNVRPVEVPFFPELQSLFEQIGNKSSIYVLGKIDEFYDEKKLSNKSDKMKKLINRELSDFSKEFKLSVDLKIKTARDCFASSLYRSDVSIVKISKMLNHSNTVVTEHYLTGLGTDELFDINEHLCRKNVS